MPGHDDGRRNADEDDDQEQFHPGKAGIAVTLVVELGPYDAHRNMSLKDVDIPPGPPGAAEKRWFPAGPGDYNPLDSLLN